MTETMKLSRRSRLYLTYLLQKRKVFVIGYILKSRMPRYAGGVRISDDGRPVTVMFAPLQPGYAYTLWKVVRMAGLRIVPPSDKMADIVIRFEDKTFTSIDQSISARWHDLNRRCTDISKDHVSRVFGQVFDYDLSIDPLIFQGRAVAKSKENFRHDGHIVDCPIAAIDPALAYQKLVDTVEGDQVTDLRTWIVGDRVTAVTVMRRPAATPFADMVTSVSPIAVDQAFSAEEQRLIIAFCRALGLDLGELDILRDRVDGRIYIVDANKTSASPSVRPDFRTGFEALLQSARAFKSQYGQKPPEPVQSEIAAPARISEPA